MKKQNLYSRDVEHLVNFNRMIMIKRNIIQSKEYQSKTEGVNLINVTFSFDQLKKISSKK